MDGNYEQKLLTGWEEVFKKSQLTLWIMLALKDGPKVMAEIKHFITTTTDNLIEADDKSIYRALRRYSDAQMVEYELTVSDAGPDKKLYSLTGTGRTVLEHFISRNILGLFFKPQVRQLLTS